MSTNAAANEKLVAEANLKLVVKILDSAAHLVVAMHDPEYMVERKKLSPEVRVSLDILKEELDEAELLVPYKQDGGGLELRSSRTAKFKPGDKVIFAEPEADPQLQGQVFTVCFGPCQCLTSDKQWIRGYAIVGDGEPYVAVESELEAA